MALTPDEPSEDTHMPYELELGEFLCSDQGTEVESAVLDHIADACKLLESLTFENDRSLQNERTRDSAALLCDALWRILYYANGS